VCVDCICVCGVRSFVFVCVYLCVCVCVCVCKDNAYYFRARDIPQHCSVDTCHISVITTGCFWSNTDFVYKKINEHTTEILSGSNFCRQQIDLRRILRSKEQQT